MREAARRGATGVASHGWTRQQVDSFVAQCRSAGFRDIETEARKAGRRDVWVVRARRL